MVWRLLCSYSTDETCKSLQKLAKLVLNYYKREVKYCSAYTGVEVKMMHNSLEIINYLRRSCPNAVAQIRGNSEHTRLFGRAEFYQTKEGVLVSVTAYGLPENPSGFHGFHIHEGRECSGDEDKPFSNALGHYNPQGAGHPSHAGDLPPLLNNGGSAFMLFRTARFTVREIIGRVVIIHAMADDFVSQPSGNSGEMIACGRISRN
jgi:Cu-Zn family superoxide dismutase